MASAGRAGDGATAEGEARRSGEAHAPTRVLFVYFHIRASSAMVAVKLGRAGGCDCDASVAYSGLGICRTGVNGRSARNHRSFFIDDLDRSRASVDERL